MKQRNYTRSNKNKASYEGRLLKMNDDTYALRRKVIDIIYLAKREVDLPRIEVRIVEGTKSPTEGSELMGYAYMGQNIVHIEKKFVSVPPNVLVTLVLHEILHAVKSAEHDSTCLLMKPFMSVTTAPNMDKIWGIFKSYFK